jgi:hypothetical protein
MKLSAIRSASKKFLVTRETMSVFPSMAAFARLLEATIELHRSIDPDDEGLAVDLHRHRAVAAHSHSRW